MIEFLEKKKKKKHTLHEFRRFLTIAKILIKHYFGVLEWHGTIQQFCEHIILLASSGLLKHSHGKDSRNMSEIFMLFMTFYRANGQRAELSPTGLIPAMYKAQAKLNSKE